MSINIVNLVGRVGADPEVRYFESGSVLCNLTLAVNRPTKDDRPDWFNLEMWGKTAELAANYLKKGKQIAVQGSLKIDTFTNRNGQDCSKPVIRVNRFEFLGSRRDDEASANSTDNYSGHEF